MALFLSLTGLVLLTTGFRAHAIAVTVLPPVVEADGRLGLDDIRAGGPPGAAGGSWAQMAVDAGARVNRWEFRWDRIEATRGSWSFAADDPVVQSDTQHSLETLGILIGTPGWAAAKGQKPGNGLPAGLYRSRTDPGNLWATYVRRTVAHYGRTVDAWEVWNEPDLAYFWSARAVDYVRLLKVAYLVIKDTVPTDQVLMAGMVVNNFGFLTTVLQSARSDPGWSTHHGYADAAAWHIYGATHSAYTNITSMRALMDSHGYPSTPIWVTEDGFPAANPNGTPRQAAYVLQTIGYALAAGATRVLIYRASDDPVPKEWGLIGARGVPRPGYVSFQVAARYLAGAESPVYIPGANVERLTFFASSMRVTMMWNHGQSDIDEAVAATRTSATLVDWQGNVTPVTAEDGQYRFTLPGASYNIGVDPRNAVIGGPPVLLLEDTTVPPSLTQTAYALRPGTTQNTVALFNPGPASATVALSQNNERRRHVVVDMPAASVRTVNLGTLSGETDPLLYRIRSSVPLPGSSSTAAGTGTLGLGSDSALQVAGTDWWVPANGNPVEVTAPLVRSSTVTLTAFSSTGVREGSAHLTVQPRSDVMWLPPPTSTSIHITSNVAVLAESSSEPASPLLSAAPTWYAVGNGTGDIQFINPSATVTATVQVTAIDGAAASPPLSLAPHTTLSIPVTPGGETTFTATAPLLASRGSTPQAVMLTSSLATSMTALLAGPQTALAIYNPASTSLQISGESTVRDLSAPVTLAVPPEGVVSLPLRRVNGAPVGLSLTGSLPFVAVPVS
jgi:hypothetical protein